ncbi:MAG: hypothetical protein WBJ83_05445 [Thermacetogeniaceae bacterium]|jgi:hypothetical protein
MRCETIKKKSIVIYIFTVGTILGVLSIFSDIIPYQLKDESIFEMILFILGGLMNNLAIWFLLSMILGYKFCNSLRCSVINGGYFAVFAIVLYFIFSYLITMDVQPVFNWVVFLSWIVVSAVGGAIGSIVGFLAQRYNILWGIPIAFIILQLIRYGKSIWHQPISIVTNIILLTVAFGLLIFSIAKAHKRH